jgi:hypothetical protein
MECEGHCRFANVRHDFKEERFTNGQSLCHAAQTSHGDPVQQGCEWKTRDPFFDTIIAWFSLNVSHTAELTAMCRR